MTSQRFGMRKGMRDMASSSEEDYLRTVYELSLKTVRVRSADVARALGVSKPSVHRALSNLEAAGYLTQERYSPVELTKSGIEEGKRLSERYQTVMRFLEETLGVDKEEAQVEAHNLEHSLTPSTLQKLRDFLDS